MGKKIAIVLGGIAAIAAGSFVGYKLATDKQMRSRLIRSARDVYQTSRKQLNDMTEEVAIKTAKMTKNPKINQDWVNNQWEKIGL